MSTLLIKRAYRVIMLSMASMLIASMLAPIVAVASTDLVAGDTAIVSNPGGANLRTDTTVLDATTISAELPEGSTVWVQDAPVYTDTGVWVYVAADGYGPGWISTDMLSKVAAPEEALADEALTEEAPAETEPIASGLAWLEPIDSAAVVDYNNALPVDGLAVRDAIDGKIIGYAPVGTSLDVTADREWAGDVSYVRVNFNGVGGYVHGDYVELSSEAVVEEPTEEVIWVEPTEEIPVETEIVTEEVVPVETEVVTEEVAPVETEAVTEEVAPVETEVVTEEVAPVETEVVTEEVAPVEPVDETVATPTETEAVTEAPTETEVVTEEVAPVETEVVTEEVAPVETEVVTEEVAPVEPVDETVATPTETEAVTEAPTETEVVTEEVIATPTEALTETEVVTAEPTEAATETEAATKEATKAPVEPTKVPAKPTVAPTEATTPVSIASTANKFDSKAMIGSATVTGTTSGLLCRVSPDPASPVLMTLSEGTKVLVSAEAVNGYLGIDCGGLQGFADVNFLWSGGAGDAEISAAKMNVVVTGTGNGLNCRTGAGLSSSVITTIFDGTTLVTRGAASNGWTPVVCGGQNGFVSTTWIEAGSGSSNSGSGSTATKGTATVSAGGDGLYCRSGAGTSYGVITVLRDNSSVSVRGAQQGEWVPVTCGGSAGFAHSSFLNVSAGSGSTTPDSGTGTATGNVTVANTGGQGLNCRSGVGTANSVISVLALGQTVKTRSGSTNGWTAVICGGSNGFVSSEFVSGGSGSTTPTKPAPTAPSGLASGTHVKTTDALNLRYSANGSSSISTVIPAGKVIKTTGAISNDYYPVDYDGLTGYVHSDYVAKTSEALSQRGGSGTAPTTPKPDPAPSTPSGSAMVNYAMRYVGYPYVWASHGPASFDCSGFTYWVTQNVMGKNIGYGTWTQVSAGSPVSKANLQPGDLVFFQNTYTAGLSHVGLYIGNGQFIHAQNEETGVVISDLNSSYYGPRWYGGVRL